MYIDIIYMSLTPAHLPFKKVIEMVSFGTCTRPVPPMNISVVILTLNVSVCSTWGAAKLLHLSSELLCGRINEPRISVKQIEIHSS